MRRNEVVIDGRLLKRGALRYTPAGTPAIDVLIGHNSEQNEAGSRRRTQCEIEATAIGETAVSLGAARLNQLLQIHGFLDRRSVGNSKLALHVVRAEAISGSDNE